MSKKTIQFKLPALTAEVDFAARDLDDAGEWVTDSDSAILALEPIGTFTAAPPADNDQTEACHRRDGGPLLAVERLSCDGVRAFLRGAGGVAESGVVLTLGLQAVSHEWLRMPLDAVQQGLDGFGFAGCRSLSDLIVLQSRLTRLSLDEAFVRCGRIARLSVQAYVEAGEALAAGFRPEDSA